YLNVKAFKDGNEVIEDLKDRLNGRIAVEDIINPNTEEIIVEKDKMITPDEAELIEKVGIEEVKIRTVLNCQSRFGVCAKCYGKNLATGDHVGIGESVGIIAAQSIGEPGTQLTMRTFHTGGVAAAADITQGLPRVEELFEARKPKGLAVISEIAGEVSFNETKNKREIIVTGSDGEKVNYNIVYGARLKVKSGDIIEAGDELTEGSVNPHDILKIRGIQGVQNYIVKEVQRVYRLQGVDINDKHIEIIVRQMLSKIKIEDAGDTDMLPGSLVNIYEFEEKNEVAMAEDQEPAIGSRALLGITKASLATDSFLSAASFQETTRVLTESAIKGKEDHLLGLKENIIIGKLIPAGTGMKRYRDVDMVVEENLELLGENTVDIENI
ncbi:MAG TPA: DNA-directed RNA polymerase subunit beta', partial [Tissierellales bacterium]|nr:DNA-directed RNA polymerase subunit beta' [Tissierellales bacterium]